MRWPAVTMRCSSTRSSEQALLAKGMMHGALGQLEEARQYCDRALKINPRSEQAWVNMGTALDALNRRTEALGCYNNALTLNPRNAQAWFNAGVLLGDMGRHEEALGCCERSLTPQSAQRTGLGEPRFNLSRVAAPGRGSGLL